MRIKHYLLYLVLTLECGVAPVDGIGTCTETPSHLYLHRDIAAPERLGIGVADHKAAALDALVEHVVHSVATASAHAEHLDYLV